MKKCAYCKKEAENDLVLKTFEGFSKTSVTFHYCCEEHKSEIQKMVAYVNANGLKFFLSIGLSCVLMMLVLPVSTAISGNHKIPFILFCALPLFVMGVTIAKYPFATPETNRIFGIKKSQDFARLFGALLACTGIVFGILSFFNIL